MREFVGWDGWAVSRYGSAIGVVASCDVVAQRFSEVMVYSMQSGESSRHYRMDYVQNVSSENI